MKNGFWTSMRAKTRKRELVIPTLIMLVAIVLRLFCWGQQPPELYWDEMALAYDAWSIAQTGRDYHGQAWPVVAFESYGDYKPSGYFYAAALAIKIFGPNNFAVRLPSLLAGIFLVWGCGEIVARLFGKRTLGSWQWRWVAMAIAALNPALLHLSRVAFETNLATAFLVGGIICLLPLPEKVKKTKKRNVDWSLWLGVVCFLAAFYTYHSMRVVAPLIGIYLAIWWWLRARRTQTNKDLWVNVLVAGILVLVGVWPMARELTSNSVTDRFQTTAIFYDLDLIKASNQCRELAGGGLLAKWWCHRFGFFGREIAQKFFEHFSFDYLFISGDSNPRHAIQFFGVFLPLEIVALVGAGIALLRQWQRDKKAWCFLFFWVVVGILPASITDATPHLLRTLSVVPALIVMLTVGWSEWYTLVWPRWRRLAVGLVAGVYAILVLGWQYVYHTDYAHRFASVWQDGYREMIQVVSELQKENADLPVYISREYGRPALYYLWYKKIAPELVQNIHDAQQFDQGEFLTYTPEKVFFGTGWQEKEQIFALTPAEYALLESSSSAKAIVDASGQTVFLVGKYKVENKDAEVAN